MKNIVKLAADMGISEPGKPYAAVLAMALGAGDTTVLRMVNAYSILANNGRALTPSLVDFVQDRRGKVIFRMDTRPCENCTASRQASSMCRNRIESSWCDIQILRLSQYVVSKILAEALRRIQVHLPTEQRRKLLLHAEERQAGNMPRLEFGEHIHVALRTEVLAQHRPKQRQPTNVVTLAKARDLGLRNWQWVMRHGMKPFSGHPTNWTKDSARRFRSRLLCLGTQPSRQTRKRHEFLKIQQCWPSSRFTPSIADA